VPSSFSGDGFLGGVEVPLSSRLPGGVTSVTWKGQFSSDTSGVTVKWQWAAAAYQSFSSNYNALDVKPVDGRKLSAFANSDLAGTPEAFKKDVVAGALGDGGTDYTGSFTSTASVKPPVQQQQPQEASLAGFVTNQTNGSGIGQITVELEDSSGDILSTVLTNADGSYNFTGLTPGTYQLVAVGGGNLIGLGEQVGTVNGNADGTDLGSLTIGSIVLANGNSGINYNFLMGAGG
jgi:Carboxypeptidase regulatory-like domain